MKRDQFEATSVTSKQLANLLPKAVAQIGETCKERPDLIVAIWPELIGEKLAPMTRALKFEGGILTVLVKSSTVLSLLSVHEKPRLLRLFKEKFPTVSIRGIHFRIG